VSVSVSVTNDEKPRWPSWNDAAARMNWPSPDGPIRPVRSPSSRNVKTENPATSVRSRSKNAPTCGPSGPSSTSRVISAHAPSAGNVPPAPRRRLGYPAAGRSSYTRAVASASSAAAGDLSLRRRRVVFLVDAASPLEERLLDEWIKAHHVPTGIPFETVAIPPSRRRRRRNPDRAPLEGARAAPPAREAGRHR